MREYAQTIRERVPTRDLVERIGLQVSRQGYVACPFHGEKTPSLKIYDSTGGWHCFGCGAHGSVIDFAMQYYGISFAQAVTRLDADFFLRLPLSRKMTPRERLEESAREETRRKEMLQREWKLIIAEREYWYCFDRVRMLDMWALDYRPKTPEEEWHPLYVYAKTHIPEARENLEIAEYERVVVTCRKSSQQTPRTIKAS